MKGDIEHLKGDDHISKLCPTINEIIERVKVQQSKIEEFERKIKAIEFMFFTIKYKDNDENPKQKDPKKEV